LNEDIAAFVAGSDCSVSCCLHPARPLLDRARCAVSDFRNALHRPGVTRLLGCLSRHLASPRCQAATPCPGSASLASADPLSAWSAGQRT